MWTSAIGNRSHTEGENTYAVGTETHAEGFGTSAIGDTSHSEGGYTKANGKYSHAEGYRNISLGDYSHTEGGDYDSNPPYDWWPNQAIGKASHAEGAKNNAVGNYSHAEGFNNQAVGYASHTEGEGTSAFSYESHAEGYKTYASGDRAHAEGYQTSAIMEGSHAEGSNSIASGYVSHAEGYYTIAGSEAMHAGGKYNATTADALFVIGNGTADDSRSDAFIIYHDGSVSAAGKISANGVELGAGGGSEVNYSYITVNMPYITPSYDFTWVQIGNQKWMDCNLNIDDGGPGYTAYSAYSNNGDVVTARNLYTYEAAKRIANSIPGWHLPTYNEVSALFKTLGDCQKQKGSNNNYYYLFSKYGKKLKSQSGWPIYSQGYENAANGTDDYGFKCYPLWSSTAYKDNEDNRVSTYFWCYEKSIIYDEGTEYAKEGIYPLYIYLDNYSLLYNNYDYIELLHNDWDFNAGFNVRLIKDEE